MARRTLSSPTKVLLKALAAVTATALAVLVVLIVTAEPVGAANSAAEFLDGEGERPFGGRNRYETAAALAQQRATDSSNSAGFVDTAIIASGDRGAPDSAVAAGLAGLEEAVVLLTEPDRLTPVTKNFLESNFIRQVIVLGGTEAVSEEVVAELGTLDGISPASVSRVAGDDRIETSVAVAREMGTTGEYCDTGVGSIILVNANSPTDAALVASLSYRSNLPVLFTTAEALAPTVDTFLKEARVEHVLMVGGAAELSEAVVQGVQAAGVNSITRIDDDSPSERSVALARAVRQCVSVAISERTFALVDSRYPIDAAAASAPLGAGLGARAGTAGQSDTTALVPILLVDDMLSSEVSLLLEEIPLKNSGDVFVEARLVAIGGVERISAAVMEAALDAATTSRPLTARISAPVGSNRLTIQFSGPVTNQLPDSLGDLADYDMKNRDNYLIAEAPLISSDQVTTTNGRTLTIVLSSYTVRAGDTFEVIDGAVKGAGSDNRRVRGTRVVAVELAQDNARPRVSLEVAANSPVVVVEVEEANPFGGSSRALQAADVTVTRADGSDVRLGTVEASTDGLRYVVDLAGEARLEAGDTVSVRAGAVADANGLTSRSQRAIVSANSRSPRAITATITNPKTLVDPGPDGLLGSLDDTLQEANVNAGLDENGEWVECGAPSADTAEESACLAEFALQARSNSRASGVAGSLWGLQLIFDPGLGANDPDVVVDTSISRSIVSVSYGTRAKVSDVITALRADHTTVSRFEISDSNEAADPLMRVDEAGTGGALLSFEGGTSQVELTLTYNEALARFNGISTASAEAEPDALYGTEAAPLACAAPATAPDAADPRTGGALKAAQTDPVWTGGASGPADSPSPIEWQIRYDPPSRKVLITLTSSTVVLPTSVNTLVLPAGLGVNFDCQESALVTEQHLRRAS